MITIDNFLQETYQELKDHSINCEFDDIENPIDGVTYPLICRDIPQGVLNEIKFNLNGFLHRDPVDPMVFMRRSPKGVKCPHIHHSDNSHGKYSLMLYLDTTKGAGTGLVEHIETGVKRPTADVLKKIIRDQNVIDKWNIYKVGEMVENRAVIFDSSLLHCALPYGGYGEGKDARTVLTVFFS